MILSTFTSHLRAQYFSLIDQFFVEINHLSCCCATTVQCPRVLHMQDVVATRHSHTSLPYYYILLQACGFQVFPPPLSINKSTEYCFLIAISLFECSLVPRPERGSRKDLVSIVCACTLILIIHDQNAFS